MVASAVPTPGVETPPPASYGQPYPAHRPRHDPRPNRVAFDFRDGWSESVLKPYETMRGHHGQDAGLRTHFDE